MAATDEAEKRSLADSGWDHAGLVWHGKRPKAGNERKMEIQLKNGPKLNRGKNGKKNPQNFNGK